MRVKNAVISGTLLCIFTGALFGAYPLATDDAGVVSKNGYELEAGYDTCKDDAEITDKNCGVSFKHGITDKMDLGISFPLHIDPAEEENMDAASVAFKFSLVKDMLAVSVTNELGEKDYFLNAIFTRELPFATCSINAGYLSTGDKTVRGKGSYGAAVEVPVRKIDIVGEFQGQEGGSGSGLVGARFRILEGFFIAAGFSKDFQTSANKTTVGFHFEF